MFFNSKHPKRVILHIFLLNVYLKHHTIIPCNKRTMLLLINICLLDGSLTGKDADFLPGSTTLISFF